MYHYKFTGCFVDPQEFWNKIKKIRTSPLRIAVPIPHVTFAYRPAFIDESLFGIPMTITITGYGCDGQNEAVKVKVKSDNPKLEKMIQAIAVPHITISLSEGAEAVNSRGLDFKPVQHVTLQGVYGSATEDDEVITNVNPSDRLLIENSSF